MPGGVKDTADVTRVRLTRLSPKQTSTIDLWQLMFDGDASLDVVLQPGDVVYVPKATADAKDIGVCKIDNRKPMVRVFGTVKAPGLVAIADGDDIASTIAKAGGFRKDASTADVLLSHTNRDGTVTTETINIKATMRDRKRTKLLAGDLLTVKRSIKDAPGVGSGRPSSLLHLGVPVGDFDPPALR